MNKHIIATILMFIIGVLSLQIGKYLAMIMGVPT